MSDRDRETDALEDLETRLEKARGRTKVRREETPPSKLGIAFRLSTEFVAAVVVGGGIGWALDRYFGTAPILMLVMFFLGVAAGFRNILRTSKELNENAETQNGSDGND